MSSNDRLFEGLLLPEPQESEESEDNLPTSAPEEESRGQDGKSKSFICF